MILKLKAKHFKDAMYWTDNCPIGRAFREQRDEEVVVGIHFLWVSNTDETFNFEDYKYYDFEHDCELARYSVHNKIIRKIKLTPERA